MTNKQLQDVLKQYPDDCEIIVKSCTCYEECEIIRIQAEYSKYSNNFNTPILTLEYEKRK